MPRKGVIKKSGKSCHKTGLIESIRMGKMREKEIRFFHRAFPKFRKPGEIVGKSCN